MLDDNIKEKVFVLLVILLIGLSFISHIPQFIEAWESSENYSNEYLITAKRKLA
jgi:hypothetical protein